MTTRVGHLLRKKFYSERRWRNYCIDRYDREKAREERKKAQQDAVAPRYPVPIQSKPPKIPLDLPRPRDPGPSDSVMVLPKAPEVVHLDWEYEHGVDLKKPRRLSAAEQFERQDSMGWPPPGHHFEGGLIVGNKPCRSCKRLREDYAKKCIQNLNQCPTCGSKKRRKGRCADNWHAGDCGIVYC